MANIVLQQWRFLKRVVINTVRVGRTGEWEAVKRLWQWSK